MPSSFVIELWTKYAIATATMAFRFGTRWKMVGWRNFDGSDFWCAVSIALYTMVSVCDYILSTPGYPTIIALDEDTAMQVLDEDIPALERGSKVAHFSWSMYICMLFAFKGVILCFFKKVGAGIWEVQISYTIVFTIIAWIASFLAHICGCVPIQRVWQVKPFPGPYCTTRPQNFYVAGVLNMLTDFIIMIIPIPMLWRLKVNLRRKLALFLLFGSGIFLIICTILRTVYSLTNVKDIAIAQAWADREGFVCVLVVSAPGIWPLVRKSRWFNSTNRSSDDRTDEAKRSSQRWKSSGSAQPPRGETCLQTENDDYEMPCCYAPNRSTEPWGTSGSEERIMGPPDEASESSREEGILPIVVTTEYSVEHEKVVTGGKCSLHSLERPRSSEWVS